MKKNKDIDLNNYLIDLNNYLFNKISDIEIRLKYYLNLKKQYENEIHKDTTEKIKAICSTSYLNDAIKYFKGMLKAYQEILSILIGEDVRKL